MTYKLIDYERLKAFSEGLKSKYATKKELVGADDRSAIQLTRKGYTPMAIGNLENVLLTVAVFLYENPTYQVSSMFEFMKTLGASQTEKQTYPTNRTGYKEFKCVGLYQKEMLSNSQYLLLKDNQGTWDVQEIVECLKHDITVNCWILRDVLSELNSMYDTYWTTSFTNTKYVTNPNLQKVLQNYVTKTAITDDFEKQSQDKVLSQKGVNDLYRTLTEQYSQVVNGVNKQLEKTANKSDIPTELSQLTNDANFKTEAEIQSMIEKASSLKKEVVTSLPTTGKDDVIYLVKDDKGKDNNNYLEYLWLNGKYELIGSTQVDLSKYATNKEIEQLQMSLQSVVRNTANVLDKEKDKAQLKSDTDWRDDTTYTTPYFVGQAVGTLTTSMLQGVDDYLEEEMPKKLDKTTDKAIAPQDSNPNSSVWQDDNKYVTPKFLSAYVDLEISGRDETIQTLLGSKLGTTDIQEFTEQEIEEAFK